MRRLNVLALVVLLAVVFIPTAGAQTVGESHWYNKAAVTGKFSVMFTVPDGQQSIVAVVVKANTTIGGISVLDFDRKILACTNCWPPSILLGIDKDTDGEYEAEDFAWQFSGPPGSRNSALLHGDSFVQCEAPTTAAVDSVFVTINAYTAYNCWSPNAAGTDFGPDYAPLGTSAFNTPGGSQGINKDSPVRAIKVLAGGAASWMAYSALVDEVKLNGTTLIDEPNNSKAHFEVVVPPSP